MMLRIFSFSRILKKLHDIGTKQKAIVEKYFIASWNLHGWNGNIFVKALAPTKETTEKDTPAAF